MTFEQVIEAGRPAFNTLEGGTLLRYEPKDGSLSMLSYPAKPKVWREAPAYLMPAPESGWTHYPGCRCACCGAATVTAQAVLAGHGVQRGNRDH